MWSKTAGTAVKASTIRVAMYLENFVSIMKPQPDGTLAMNIGEGPCPFISVADVGLVVDGMLAQGADVWNGKAMNAAAESITGHELAGIMSGKVKLSDDADAASSKVNFVNVPREVYASFGFPGDVEIAEMFAFYQHKAFTRDPAATAKVATGKLTSVKEFFENYAKSS
eukprot:GFYU01004976.1.p1 GENE.GFYU01004976.1~~GFYU01004976.1.p1  ORF type:complete len:169 (-),score=59.11 GFYU01004976.1:27-533(-)